MNNMTVITEYATYKECRLIVAKYRANDGLAIQIWNDEEGPIASLTVCLPNELKPIEGGAYVDTNNCPWAEQFIKENELGEFTGLYGYSGYCAYPLYVFDVDKLNKA